MKIEREHVRDGVVCMWESCWVGVTQLRLREGKRGLQFINLVLYIHYGRHLAVLDLVSSDSGIEGGIEGG